MDLGIDSKHLIIYSFLRFFNLVVWQPEMKLGAVLGYQALEFIPVSQNPGAADKLVIPDPDQSYYQFRSTPKLWLLCDPVSVLVHHTLIPLLSTKIHILQPM